MATRRKDSEAAGPSSSSSNAPMAPIATTTAPPQHSSTEYVQPAPLPVTAALMLLPLLVSLAFPLLGCALYAGKVDRVIHTSTFERWFHSLGTLMAFPPLMLRVVANQLLPGSGLLQRGRSPLSSPIISMAIHLAAQAVRLVVYEAHKLTIAAGLWLWLSGNRTDHAMADHILLALAVCASLCCELAACVMAARTLLRAPSRKAQARALAGYLLGALYAWVLIVLVSGNMYTTARYFHIAAHTLCALVFGVGLFFGPALWLVFKHCVPCLLVDAGDL